RVTTDSQNEGIQGSPWDLVAGRTYVIEAQVFPVTAGVKMQVSGTTAFDNNSQGRGEWETLRVIHTPTSTLTGVRLQFIASEADHTEFFVDQVAIYEYPQPELDIDGGMEQVSSWSSIGTPVND